MKFVRTSGFLTVIGVLSWLHAGYAAPLTTQPKAPMIERQGAPAPIASVALLNYQIALDQISQGHFSEARVVLEDAVQRHGNSPELNLLLGYVLEKEGSVQEAHDRLRAVAYQSPVAAAYVVQLQQGAVQSPPASSGAIVNSQAGANPPAFNTVARLSQPDARLARFEHELSQMVNTERQKQGLEPLAYDETLADVARAHSAEMRDRKYFSHESPTPTLHEPLNRYVAVFRNTPLVVAENIYSAWGSPHVVTGRDIESAHTALMNSPGHRANILFPDIRRVGIGIVTNTTGDIWVTEMFSKS